MGVLKNPLIFIVEDNKIYNQLIVKFLSQKGFTNVKSFSNGEDCLRNMNLKPDIVIQDYLLDGLNGIEVLKRAKKHYPETEFIFLSGQSSMEIAVNSMRYGAYDYIVKDETTMDRLVDKIGKIGETKRIARKNKVIKIILLCLIVFLLLVILAFVIFIIPKFGISTKNV
ncbi:MAG: response regulator [Prolixibacteraceae bacterium]|nr:response regulator [Prolixibacteraceae bacterium]MBN2773908.1 response regulator [Prolixibacteraceae bacterium]